MSAQNSRAFVLRIFIGYDSRETVAYHALCQSILERSTIPVSFTPINITNIRQYQRPADPLASTEFSFSRFLVPWLCNYSGYALFLDCDMLVRCDIAELLPYLPYTNAVSVVKHDYTPRTETKFLGNVQSKYPRKNWSSVMLFNCGHYHCRRLTPDVVNTQSGAYLHRFEWTDRIGTLPPEWNYLVGEDQPEVVPKIVHYTLGGPYFPEYANCDFSSEWFETEQRMNSCG